MLRGEVPAASPASLTAGGAHGTCRARPRPRGSGGALGRLHTGSGAQASAPRCSPRRAAVLADRELPALLLPAGHPTRTHSLDSFPRLPRWYPALLARSRPPVELFPLPGPGHTLRFTPNRLDFLIPLLRTPPCPSPGAPCMLTPVLIKRRSPHHGPPHHTGTLGTRLALRVWSPPSSRVGPGSNFLHSRLGLRHRVPGPAAQPRRLSSVKLGHFLETRSSLPSTSVYYPTTTGSMDSAMKVMKPHPHETAPCQGLERGRQTVNGRNHGAL